MDPHDRLVRGDLGEGVGEALVHRLVGLPVGAAVRRVAERVVVQRPQGVVGEALVVVLHLLGGHEHRVQVDAVEDERLGRVVGLAGPADPRAAAGAQQRQQGPHEAARARRPAAVVERVDREPVGGDRRSGGSGSTGAAASDVGVGVDRDRPGSRVVSSGQSRSLMRESSACSRSATRSLDDSMPDRQADQVGRAPRAASRRRRRGSSRRGAR